MAREQDTSHAERARGLRAKSLARSSSTLGTGAMQAAALTAAAPPSRRAGQGRRQSTAGMPRRGGVTRTFSPRYPFSPGSPCAKQRAQGQSTAVDISSAPPSTAASRQCMPGIGMHVSAAQRCCPPCRPCLPSRPALLQCIRWSGSPGHALDSPRCRAELQALAALPRRSSSTHAAPTLDAGAAAGAWQADDALALPPFGKGGVGGGTGGACECRGAVWAAVRCVESRGVRQGGQRIERRGPPPPPRLATSAGLARC